MSLNQLPSPAAAATAATPQPVPHPTWKRLTHYVISLSVLLTVALWLDAPIFHALERVRWPVLGIVLNLVVKLGNGAFPVVVALALYLAGVRFERPKLRRLAGRVLLSALITGSAVVVLKPLIARHELEFKQGPASDATWLEQRWGRFPSGHAAIAFATVTPIVSAFPQAGWLLYGAAAMVGLARLYCAAHLFSDVLFGALLGLGIANWVERRDRPYAPLRAAPALPPLQRPRARARIPSLVLILMLSVPLLFAYLGGWSFGDPDEGRYATIAAEMLRSGDFVTPTINQTVYFEKPPLFYWSVAAGFRMFESAEWSARLVPSLFALLGAVVTYLWGKKMFGERAGRWSAVMLLTSLIWPVLGRLLVIDMQLSVLMLIAFASWWSIRSRSLGPHRIDVGVFWITIGLACLSKGPVAVVLVLGAIAAYALVAREWKVLIDWRWLAGAPLAVAVAAPWFWLMAQRHPSFNHFFWYEQHIGRFLGLDGSLEHQQPFWYFGLAVPLSLFPWSALLPMAIAGGRRRLWPLTNERRRAAAYLLVCCSVIVVFFSLSKCKLMTYTLPAIPLICLLIGAQLDATLSRGGTALRRLLSASSAILIVLLTIGGGAMAWFGPEALMRLEGRAPTEAYALTAVLWTWAAALAWVWWRGRPDFFVRTVTIGAVALVFSLVVVMVRLAPNHTMPSLLTKLRPGLAEGAEVVTYNGWMQSLPYYLERRIRVFGAIGEMKFGYESLPVEERQQWYGGDFSDLRHYLAQDRPIYCVVSDHETAQELLAKLGHGYAEVAWNTRRSIIGNRQAVAALH